MGGQWRMGWRPFLFLLVALLDLVLVPRKFGYFSNNSCWLFIRASNYNSNHQKCWTIFHTWGSWSLSVIVACLNDPRRVKLELEESKFIETVHSLSRFCLRSRHMANAQPTAWLNRSPYHFKVFIYYFFLLGDLFCHAFMHNVIISYLRILLSQ